MPDFRIAIASVPYLPIRRQINRAITRLHGVVRDFAFRD